MRRIPWNRPLVINGSALALAALIVLVGLPGLLAAVLTPSLDADRAAAGITDLLNQHAADKDAYQSRFVGRSLFHKPPAPRPKTPPPVARRQEEPAPIEDLTPKPPPVPRSYDGPSILFVLGEEVWFQNGLRLRVGEEADGITVISSDAPWKVKLGYRGGEFDQEIFKRIEPGLESQPRAQQGTPGLVLVDSTDSDDPDSETEGTP